MICWKCHEAVQGPVCPSCGILQPPPPQADFYTVLGLPRAYHLDLDELESRWRDRSRQVHPDRYARKSAVLRRMSLQWTALVNDARRVLRDPVRRAWYLATGKPRPPERGGAPTDPDFLEAVFEWRMALAEGDTAVLDKVRAAQQTLSDEIGEVFHAWEAGDGDLGSIEPRLQRLKYLDNLLQHDT